MPVEAGVVGGGAVKAVVGGGAVKAVVGGGAVEGTVGGVAVEATQPADRVARRGFAEQERPEAGAGWSAGEPSAGGLRDLRWPRRRAGRRRGWWRNGPEAAPGPRRGGAAPSGPQRRRGRWCRGRCG